MSKARCSAWTGPLLCLPFKVIEESLKFLKDEKCLEVPGGDLIGRVSYRFNLTELGRTGPGRDEACAPTSARRRCRSKTTSSRPTARPSPASAAAPSPARRLLALVLTDELFNAIGPAIVSGQ